ncbi:MAG: putative membrane-anchored protein conserved in bacteria [Rhodobacteraceae bacterium HLUCCO18]|nr:MAG: putative membrane-anchored protein conserved in bacteria [Rhodobacteraceae bacterium HLUCCO18]
MSFDDHPLRYALTNELHARPFPSLTAPGQAIYLAIKEPSQAAKRDRGRDRAHLLALLDRFGAQHPKPDATHFFGDLGKFRLKWEQHTEFVTYTAFVDNGLSRPFDPAAWEVFPEDWLADIPGARITSAHLVYLPAPEDEAEIEPLIHDWFVPESLAVSRVLDDTAAIAGDFRIDSSGHLRFAIFTRPDTGQRRLGRVVQRICEIETYKTMSMLGLPRAREISGKLGQIDERLSHLVTDMTGDLSKPDETLGQLLAIASELEKLQTESAFRFGATGAYDAIVTQRVQVLREERFRGRQTFAEFMMRRFDPAMRTVKSTEARLEAMTTRAIRAGDLLRTRVDVDRSAQNQALLESMDRRSDMALRLQKTVEGLSVVAISYYAVNLVVYLIGPLAEPLGISETLLTALAVVPTVLTVWMIVRSIRKSVEK